MTMEPRDNTNDPTPWAVICPNLAGMLAAAGNVHDASLGVVFLSEAQYVAQLISDGEGWKCPGCGADAEWDDYCQETNPPEDQ